MSYLKQDTGKGRGRGTGQQQQPQQQQQQRRPPQSTLQSDFPQLGQTSRPQSAAASALPPPPKSAWGKPVQQQTPPPASTPSPAPSPAPTPTPPPPQIIQETVTQSVITSLESVTISSEPTEARGSVSPFETPAKPSERDSRQESPPKSLTVRVHNGEFPAKIARGDLGRVIKLRANHYVMRLKREYIIYQYDVEIKRKNEPQDEAAAKLQEARLIKNKRLMREMFVHLMGKILTPEYKNKVVYNFSKNLYSLVKLPFEANVN